MERKMLVKEALKALLPSTKECFYAIAVEKDDRKFDRPWEGSTGQIGIGRAILIPNRLIQSNILVKVCW